MRDNPEAEVYFFDESRFGTHSKQGLGWFKKGSRTEVRSKLGYQSFYLYSATSHISGRDFTLVLPYVNKACMQLYLNEFAKNVINNVILVMDQAGWHKGLDVPANIEIIFLPPYSPELNPVERFWLYIKDSVLKNKIYDTLDCLELAVIEFLNKISSEKIKTVCNCAYI